MKKLLFVYFIVVLLISACKKEGKSPVVANDNNVSLVVPFTRYDISEGQQFCNQSTFVPVEYAELNFMVKFDSSAIYTTKDPANQNDINKLYGFSDNDSLHQRYSARFGWRWSNNALRVFAYIYNDGVRSSKELGTILIGKEDMYSIKVADGYYVFSLNNIPDTLPRFSKTSKGKGYKLYPYFGGDETAPHDITILIKEIKPN